MSHQESHATFSSSPSVAVEHVELHMFDQVLADMGRLCLNERSSDVTFLVEDQCVPTHRQILAVRSKYFHDMLYGSTAVSKDRPIRLEAPLEAFKVILGYLYSGTLRISSLEVDAICKVTGLVNLYGLLEVDLELSNLELLL